MVELLDRLRTALRGRYEIERELGRGGMGTVFLARDIRHERMVAIKVLHPELSAVLGRDRFFREIQITASLQHPHILPLHDSGEAGEYLYYITPYIEGESLRDRLERDRQLSLEEAFQIARDTASALDYAHRQGVIHRDIKPENILLSSGEAVVADFGIARAIDASAGDALTQTGVSLGTPRYMSPEQISVSGTIDGRSDLYSLGCVIYEMIAGAPPFAGVSGEALMRQHLAARPRNISEIRETVSPELATLLEKLLAKNPADRFSTGAEFAQALRNARGVDASPSSGIQRARRHPMRSGWGYAAAAGLAIVLFLLVYAQIAGGPDAVDLSDRPMIVILPFENLGSPEDEYFADGVTEEITSQLASIDDLGVIARTSAIQYKHTDKPIEQIGEELDVDYVLEGTVRWQKSTEGPSRIRVTPQLIRVMDATHVWTDRYDAVLADVFEIQTNIAEKVTDALHLKLSEADSRSRQTPPTSNLEAYGFYLRGLNYSTLAATSEENRQAAVEMFSKAVDLDPEFALAYAGLATAHSDVYWYFEDRTEARLEQAKEAADRALELQPELPQAHQALGRYYYHGRRDYTRALAELSIALKGMPNNSETLMTVGAIYRRQGRWEEAAAMIARSSDLNPRSAQYAFEASTTFRSMRDAENAFRYIDRAIALYPDVPQLQVSRAMMLLGMQDNPDGYRQETRRIINRFGLKPVLSALIGLPPGYILQLEEEYLRGFVEMPVDEFRESDRDLAHLYKAYICRKIGAPEAAAAHCDSARLILEPLVQQHPREAEFHWRLGLAYVGLGRKDEAVREGRRAQELLPVTEDALQGSKIEIALALIYVGAGEREAALDLLEKMLARRGVAIIPDYLRSSVFADSLRGNPRFARLIAKRT